MASAREKLKPTTTDPAILEARYRFERLMEEKETRKKWNEMDAKGGSSSI